MTLHQMATERLIAEIILGLYESIINAEEIKVKFTLKGKKILKTKKEEICKCASKTFINKFDGLKLLQKKDSRKIEVRIKKSVMECIEIIQRNN